MTKSKKTDICTVPDYFDEADSDTEALGMQVEYIGKKIVELSREMNKAREVEKRMKLYDGRECFIDELKKRPEQLKAATSLIM